MYVISFQEEGWTSRPSLFPAKLSFIVVCHPQLISRCLAGFITMESVVKYSYSFTPDSDTNRHNHILM